MTGGPKLNSGVPKMGVPVFRDWVSQKRDKEFLPGNRLNYLYTLSHNDPFLCPKWDWRAAPLGH